jgi:long-chain acyl-CoA synthetase
MNLDRLPQTIPDLLRLRAEATPQGVACYSRDGTGPWQPTNWSTLWDDVKRLAARLQRLGLKRRDRLAVIARTCYRWQIAEMGGLLAGGVIVGIDPHASAEQTAFVCDHAGVTGAIAQDPARLDRLPAAVRGAMRFALPLDQAPCDDASSAGPPPLPALTGDDPATIIYTAGTTGASKGIEYTHAQVLAGARAIAELYPELSAGDRTLCWLPMAHLYQRMMNLVTLVKGMVTYFVEDPREVPACLRDVEPAFFSTVPRFLEKLRDSIIGGESRACGRNLKVLLTGSAPTPLPLLEFFRAQGVVIYEGYAMSENTVPMSASTRGAWRLGSVGKPLPQNEIRFGDDGEILVRGPGVFRGYYREEGPSDRFTADGFYRTGDVGRLDEDGFLYLVGRKAEIIKTSTGRRIAPVRVEQVYRQSPYVDQVVVFGDGRTHLVALVTLRPAAVAEAVARAGLPVPPDSELGELPLVRDLVAREFEALGKGLDGHERVGAFDILPAPLSVADGELTPTLKLRRAAIAARHADRIARLYGEARR